MVGKTGGLEKRWEMVGVGRFGRFVWPDCCQIHTSEYIKCSSNTYRNRTGLLGVCKQVLNRKLKIV